MKVNELQNVDGFIKSNLELSPEVYLRLTIDSRKIDGFSAFLALKGDRFDGHDFISKAIELGVTNVILDRADVYEEVINTYPQVAFILVEDSLKYLQESSKYKIEKFKSRCGKVFALTGSNGKTTNKEMMSFIATRLLDGGVASTRGNFNNHIGVPLTIHQEINNETKFAIIEMGTSFPGEIEFLAELVNPHFGYITNIGLAHIEFLKSQEGIFEEKTALYRNIKKNKGTFFVNTSDEFLKRLSNEQYCINCKNMNVEHQTILESYNLENLNMMAFIACEIFGQSEKVLKIASEFQMPKMNRSEWIKVGSKELFLDAYNANPSSMEKAVVEFSKQKPLNDSIYILGDMNELGEFAKSEHNRIAKLLNSLGVKDAIFIGRYAELYDEAFVGTSRKYDSMEEFNQHAPEVLNSFRYIFLKASRSLQFEKILDIKDRL